MLVAVGISDPERRLDQYPFELSGGMCQRVMIAIALISGPTILVADEPTTALDVTIQAQILDLMRQLVAERGTGVVLITHDMGVVADIADRAVGDVCRTDRGSRRRCAISSPHPAHPYTALLLASVPRLSDTPKNRLATIDGRVPSASSSAPAAASPDAVRSRRINALAKRRRCRDSAAGHHVACWHADKVSEWARRAAS